MSDGLRIVGEVPPDYSGPLWYMVVRTTLRHNTKVPFSIPSKLSDRLFGDNSGRRIFTSGEVVDTQGEFLPPFDQPVACKAKKRPSRKVEFVSWADPKIISQRVYDAIVGMDQSPFIFVALDVHLPGEAIDRWYAMYFGETALLDILDPVANDLERSTTPGREDRFKTPAWVSLGRPHFGYLKADVVQGRHLFATYSGIPIMSHALAVKIADAFDTDYSFSPLGVA